MFFNLSKIVWILVAPTNLLLLLGLIGIFFLFTRMQRTAKTLVSVSLLGLFLAGFSPIGEWALAPLENRFPQITELDGSSFDGIIVLGGASNLHITRSRNEPTIGEASERIFKLIELARRFPEKRIAFAGGGGVSADASGPFTREADVVKLLLERTGLPTENILFERQSQNTWQNARNLEAILQPAPESRWLLVTSAFHMPRAVGVFRQAGFNVIAYPVDFRLGSFAASFTTNSTGAGKMAKFDQAAHEWIGLTSYWMTGRSGAFFPGP
jgi:uncharacterized SAM-binding protein YcdF (DUF218 family)